VSSDRPQRANGGRARASVGDVPRASVADSLRTTAEVILPLMGRGLILRRPPIVAAAERLDLDRRAVAQLRRLREAYGPGPVLIRAPLREYALVLDPDHVHRVLQDSPEPFTAANLEKEHALGHFQPDGVLVSEGEERADRRRFNEAVLDTPSPVHCAADAILAKLREEADAILDRTEARGQLTWDDFIRGWYRMIRRVVLGDHAADDHRVTDLLGDLRASANWAFLRPKREDVRAAFLTRLEAYLDRAEPGSLADLVARAPKTADTKPTQQVPQWLFASEPAGIATIRTLALLAAHPDEASRARSEVDDRDLATPQELPFLRACVLDSLRLWPTTPGILRDTTTETTWETGTLPAGTGVLIFAPFFHRDESRLPEAHRFAPDLWAEERTTEDWPLVPFSAGPVTCPGQNLVLLLSSVMLGTFLRYRYRLDPPDRLDPSGDLPSVLDPFDLTFTVEPVHAPSA
jgi:cytochrome P450